MSDTAADRPMKTLTVQMTERQVRTTQSGLQITNVTGEEQPGKKTRVVLFAENSQAFEGALSDFAMDQGLSTDDVKPTITFQGYWKKNTWTGRDGQERTTWEFNARSFTFN